MPKCRLGYCGDDECQTCASSESERGDGGAVFSETDQYIIKLNGSHLDAHTHLDMRVAVDPNDADARGVVDRKGLFTLKNAAVYLTELNPLSSVYLDKLPNRNFAIKFAFKHTDKSSVGLFSLKSVGNRQDLDIGFNDQGRVQVVQIQKTYGHLYVVT
jgi:hypothetical protein